MVDAKDLQLEIKQQRLENAQEYIAYLEKAISRYQELAECGCGEVPEYPAHGWHAGMCPGCQAEMIENGKARF